MTEILTMLAVCAVGAFLGWVARDAKAEHDQYRAEEARDAAWDAAHREDTP